MKRVIKSNADMYYWFICGLIVIFFYFLNLFTTWKGDDVLHALVAYSKEQITDWTSLVRSCGIHYMHENGRVADFLARLFCGLLGKGTFNVLNALMTILFIHLMAIYIGGSYRNILALALSLIYVLVLMPTPGETMLWLSGATNYLWAMVATLLVLKLLNRQESQQWRPSLFASVLVFVFSWLSGAMNESVSAGVLLGLVIYYALNRKLFSYVTFIILAGYALGLLFILASPSGWERLESGSTINLHITTGQLISRRVINTMTKSVHFVTPVLALMGILVLVLKRRFAIIRRDLLVWVFLAVMASIVVLSITTSYRSYTAYSVFSFLIVGRWICTWLEDKKWKMWVAIAIFVCCVPLMASAMNQVWQYKQYDDAVISSIKAAPKECVLPAQHSPMRDDRWTSYIDYDNDNYYSIYLYIYSLYFDKDYIRFLPEDIYGRYAGGRMMEGGVEAPFVSNVAGDTLRLMAFAGHPYTIIDAGTERPQVAGRDVKVYYASMEAHLGAERTARLKRWGEFPEFMPMRFYCLHTGGHYYVVLPELEDDIVTIEIPGDVHGKTIWRRFDRRPQESHE